MASDKDGKEVNRFLIGLLAAAAFGIFAPVMRCLHDKAISCWNQGGVLVSGIAQFRCVKELK